jgi:hypothetical protein
MAFESLSPQDGGESETTEETDQEVKRHFRETFVKFGTATDTFAEPFVTGVAQASAVVYLSKCRSYGSESSRTATPPIWKRRSLMRCLGRVP